MKTSFLSSLRPKDFVWTPTELLLMRVAISALILFMGVHWEMNPFQPEPEKLNGLARLIPLGWILQPAVLMTLKILTVLGLALYIVGIAPVLTLLPAMLALFGTGALRNSKGDISHSTQVLAMSLLGIWIAYLVSAIRRKPWKKADHAQHSLAIWAAILMIAASYVASGIVKLKASDGKWVQRVPNMAVQMVKSNLSDYYSKPEGDISKTLTESAPQFFTENPNKARLFFGVGLALELGAFVLLFGRRWAFVVGGMLLLMHVGISLMMKIEFWNHITLLAFICVLPGILGMFRKSESAAA